MGQLMLMAAGHDLLRASEERAARQLPQGRWTPATEPVRPKKSFKDMTGAEYELYLDQALKGTAI